jgi:hybrid cluster-associated redox disulfide protein
MSVGDALRLHPQAGEVLASFHLGGCAHCAINEQETLEEITAGYGVKTDALLEALNGLIA